MSITSRVLEGTLADVINQLDGFHCDDPESEDTLEECRERLWRLLQDIKLESAGMEASR